MYFGLRVSLKDPKLRIIFISEAASSVWGQECQEFIIVGFYILAMVLDGHVAMAATKHIT